ncbi:EamA family transporter [Actinomadura logoneensis]|uniref:EamA family transporter n=1 Tax=Actinomadura logoneensis TaxID=2293572 RepID=A0A372JGL9_9ACTN|nr:EamA family transporter [Actinomadura logoneensis]RFU39069.1 EamA family transporter [Actinomadura logoneensis]
MTTALAVIFAGVLHATWNAIAKGASDRWASFALIGLGQAVLLVPLLGLVPLPAAAAWPWLLGSVAVHLLYMGLLLMSYQLGDFSQVYPLARGSAPLIVAGVAATVLGERLSPVRFGGVAAICGGLAVLAFTGSGPSTPPGADEEAGEPPEAARRRVRDPRAVAAALATGVSIAAYTVLDGIGVRTAHGAAGYSAWLFALEAPLTVAAVLALRGRRALSGLPVRTWATGLAGGVLAMAGYGIVLWAQTRGALAAVAALRETGVIAGAVIGAVFFAESMGARRIAAACVVAAGVVLITGV